MRRTLPSAGCVRWSVSTQPESSPISSFSVTPLPAGSIHRCCASQILTVFMLTTNSHPGGPEGYVWENPARFQEPGWGGELGKVLWAVSTTTQGKVGGQLRRVAGQKLPEKYSEEGRKWKPRNLRPVAGCSRFLLPVVLCGGRVFTEWALSSRQKRLRWSRNTVFGSWVFGRKDLQKKTVLGEAMVVYNSNKKIHSFIKLGTNFTIFYVKLLLCFS